MFVTVEVEGYGPYKPVPPPKPLASGQQQQQTLGQVQQLPGSTNAGCFTPPPYRMPPYPLYNEPSIPGAASSHGPLDTQTPTATSTPQGLHTHSSKFPVSIKWFIIENKV